MPFIVCLVLVLGSGKIGISMEMAMGAAFLIIAVWWLVMSLPLLKGYEQKFYVKKQKHAVKESFCRLGQTFGNIRKEKTYFYVSACIFLLHRRSLYDYRHGNGIWLCTGTGQHRTFAGTACNAAGCISVCDTFRKIIR